MLSHRCRARSMVVAIFALAAGCTASAVPGSPAAVPQIPAGSPAPSERSATQEAPAHTPAPTPSPHRTTILIQTVGTSPIPVEVIDDSGQLTEARAPTAADRERVSRYMPESEIEIASLDPRSVFVAWVGGLCDRSTTLTISGPRKRLVVAPGPRQACDAIGIVRGVVLTFALPRAADRLVPELRSPSLEPSR